MKQRGVRILMVCLSAVLAIFLALSLRFYWEYRTFNLAGCPKRLTVHGRHFDLLGAPSPETLADAVEDDPDKPLHHAGTVRPVPGLSWGEHEVISRFYQSRPTAAYLQVAPDRYLAHSLSGSC